MKRWLLVLVVLCALTAGTWVAYAAFGPKSDRQRIEEACGGDPGHLGSIEADGTVCCDLCSA